MVYSEYVEEDLEILITMVPDGYIYAFNKTISMDDGMDIPYPLCRVLFLEIRRLQPKL